MNVNKLAANDARRWAYAEMFFGEGAGIRRRMLSAEIGKKVETIAGYHDAFQKAYAKQDFARHAINAAKERKRIDRTGLIRRNVKGLVTGNHRQLSTTVGVAVVAYVAIKDTPLEDQIKLRAKMTYNKSKARAKVMKDRVARFLDGE